MIHFAVPFAALSHVWTEQELAVVPAAAVHLHAADLFWQAVWSLFASEHWENTLQVPVVAELDEGVKAQLPSNPPALQDSLVV